MQHHEIDFHDDHHATDQLEQFLHRAAQWLDDEEYPDPLHPAISSFLDENYSVISQYRTVMSKWLLLVQEHGLDRAIPLDDDPQQLQSAKRRLDNTFHLLDGAIKAIEEHYDPEIYHALSSLFEVFATAAYNSLGVSKDNSFEENRRLSETDTDPETSYDEQVLRGTALFALIDAEFMYHSRDLYNRLAVLTGRPTLQEQAELEREEEGNKE